MRIPRRYLAGSALVALLLSGGAAFTSSDVSADIPCASVCGIPDIQIDLTGISIPPTLPWGVPVTPLADGTIVFSDGTFILPDGTTGTGTFLPNGSIQLPDGTIILNPYVAGT